MAEIKLVRLDYRLIHGQVVTQWIKMSGANRVVIINDELAADAFMGDIYRMAAPSGITVDILKIDAACAAWQKDELGDGRILVLFKTAADALRAHEGGFAFDDLQVGGLGGGPGSVSACGIALQKEDVGLLQQLDGQGVHVHVHVVPTAPDVPLAQVVEKLSF